MMSTSMADGSFLAVKYTCTAGPAAVSPDLHWMNPPRDTASYVLIVHDMEPRPRKGLDDILHWMVWNIPATATSLREGVPGRAQLPDGTRQISATGPYYRGPGAPASGPAHHYLFELFALDSMLDVPTVGASPPSTRAAVVAGMAGHIRGKGVYAGLFKRSR